MRKNIALIIGSAALVAVSYFLSDTYATRQSRQIILLKPSIQQFSNSPVNTSINQDNTISITSVGDIMLGRTVNYKAIQKDDFLWSFRSIKSLTQNADIAIGNLESPFNEACNPTNSGMIFCSDKRNIDGLLYAGFDVLSLANNHAGDQGDSGHMFTKQLLRENGIDTIGTKDQPLIKNIKGTTFAFLGYNTINPRTDNIAWGESKRISEDIEGIRDLVDVIVVSIHWGNEYTTNITNLQETLAISAIDAGADIIIGHHPHWIQNIEIHEGSPIIYSLGNFIFDQMWSQKTREGLVINIEVTNHAIRKLELIPVIINDYGEPTIADEVNKERILNNLGLSPIIYLN